MTTAIATTDRTTTATVTTEHDSPVWELSNQVLVRRVPDMIPDVVAYETEHWWTMKDSTFGVTHDLKKSGLNFERRQAEVIHALAQRRPVETIGVSPQGATCPSVGQEMQKSRGANTLHDKQDTRPHVRPDRDAIRNTIILLSPDSGAKSIRKHLQVRGLDVPLTTVKRYLREARNVNHV